jgi:hypothetical protein
MHIRGLAVSVSLLGAILAGCGGERGSTISDAGATDVGVDARSEAESPDATGDANDPRCPSQWDGSQCNMPCSVVGLSCGYNQGANALGCELPIDGGQPSWVCGF